MRMAHEEPGRGGARRQQAGQHEAEDDDDSAGPSTSWSHGTGVSRRRSRTLLVPGLTRNGSNTPHPGVHPDQSGRRPSTGRDRVGTQPSAAHSASRGSGARLVSILRLLETFFRHRFLLLGPVALVMVGAIGWVLIQPQTYDTSARVWGERQTLVPAPNSN